MWKISQRDICVNVFWRWVSYDKRILWRIICIRSLTMMITSTIKRTKEYKKILSAQHYLSYLCTVIWRISTNKFSLNRSNSTYLFVFLSSFCFQKLFNKILFLFSPFFLLLLSAKNFVNFLLRYLLCGGECLIYD